MFSFLVFAVLCASSLAKPAPDALDFYSFSDTVGSGSGTSFSIEGMGRVTAVRLWENTGSYITGIQLRHGYVWSPLVGRKTGSTIEMELHEGETIIQVSGKYQASSYIYQLIFVTSKGRLLTAGQPAQLSFNMYPANHKGELIILSGRFNSAGITSLGAHWGVVFADEGVDSDAIEDILKSDHYSTSD